MLSRFTSLARRLACLVATLAAAPVVAAQTPSWIQSPINGHWYALTPPRNVWDAHLLAQSWGGNLVTIRSLQENDWISSTFTGSFYWIGLRDNGPGLCGGTYAWMSGEPVTFTRWYPGEPDCMWSFYCSGDANWEQNAILERCTPCGNELRWRDWFGWCSWQAIVEVVSPDCDGSGAPDVYELRVMPSMDCDHNGSIDACDVVGGAYDCNGNGLPDSCDIASGTEADADGNGIPDACQGFAFCFGDGIDTSHSISCPCANTGAPGHGCANSANPAGALLVGGGSSNPDTQVLHGSGMPASSLCIYLQGDALADDVFGDGVRCAGGGLIRLRTKLNTGGMSEYPEAGDPSVSARGLVVPGSGARRYYQTFYRNPAGAFCPPATFNVTNGWVIDW